MPKRKPEAMKRLSGTSRPDRQPEDGPLLPEASTRCPRGLPKEAQKAWHHLAPVLSDLGLLTELDKPAFIDLVTCIARLKEAEDAITEHGVVVEGYRGGLVKNPAITAANQYRTNLYKWAAKFGLTPSDRDGLHIPAEDEAEVSLADELFLAMGRRSNERDDE